MDGWMCHCYENGNNLMCRCVFGDQPNEQITDGWLGVFLCSMQIMITCMFMPYVFMILIMIMIMLGPVSLFHV